MKTNGPATVVVIPKDNDTKALRLYGDATIYSEGSQFVVEVILADSNQSESAYAHSVTLSLDNCLVFWRKNSATR